MTRTETSPLTPGYRLDRYELLGPLAEGGMASVWIARQRGKHGFERLVAVKTILPQFASDDRFRQMFLDEARIASRIEHFNVARILDLGEEHDVLYLVMEYVDGDSLSKLRRECKKKGVVVPAGILMRVLADACAGLHEAHELKGEDGALLEIVHRDVSPHNILLSTRGVAKVIDFGIAKARDRLSGDTNVGVLKGKIQYMAPEQALGRRVDRRSDVWAIGASLYHLVAGRPAYHAENTLEMLHLLTSGRPPAPLPPSVHPVVSALIRKALSTPSEERFQTAAEMRDALEAAMQEAGLYASSADVGAFALEHLAERTAKRRRVIDIAIAAAAERERIEAVLKPQIDHGTGLTGLTNPPPDSGGTLSEPPLSLRPGTHLDPSLPPPASSPPMGDGDLAVPIPKSRSSMLYAGIAGVIVALGAGLLFTTAYGRSTPPAAVAMPELPSATAAGPGPTPGVLDAGTFVAISTATPPVGSGAPDEAGDVDASTGAGSSRVPRGYTPPSRWVSAMRPPPSPPPATTAAPPPPPQPDPPPEPPPHKRNVDDGF